MKIETRRTANALARALTTCAAVTALATACSSSTSGSGSTGNGGGSGAGSTGSSAPSTGSGGGGGGGGGAGGGGGGGAATGNFCTDWTHIGDLSKIISPNGIQQQLVARFDTLAAEAPPEIKSAVQDVDRYVHAAVSGHIDPSAAQGLAQDFQKIGTWIASNCH